MQNAWLKKNLFYWLIIREHLTKDAVSNGRMNITTKSEAPTIYQHNQIRDNRIKWACSRHGRSEKSTQRLHLKIWRHDSTWKTWVNGKKILK
jgi:hypothetical protein